MAIDDSGLAGPSGIDWADAAGTHGLARFGGGDKTMVVLFYLKPEHQPAESAAAGRQIFKDVTYVRIQPPGERLNIIDRPAVESDARRWPMQWGQFKQNQLQVTEGTPIEQLHPDKPAISATLRACGVQTIEQCAGLSGNAIENVGMGAQHWVNDAKKYLDMANKGVTVTEMNRAMDMKDREIARLTQNVATLQGQVDRLLNERGAAPSLETVQSLIAQVMGRPVHTPGMRMDPQAEMINANHKTNDLSKKATVRQRGKRR